MIKSFRSPEAEALFNDRPAARFRSIERPARRKLLYLGQARTIQDLLVPPGNRLEALVSDRKGQHRIRISDQFRVCFVWTTLGPKDVELVDYH